MIPEFSAPVLKTPESLEVSLLLEKWIDAGFEWKGMQMFWQGSAGGLQNYVLRDASETVLNIHVFSILSEDEKIIFRAFQDWFNQAVKKASEPLRGYFTFDVLQFEISDAPWSWKDFIALLVSHAQKISVNDRRLIQFAGLWGVLHKRTEAEFGRIESKLNLDFCKSSHPAFVRLIKKQAPKPASRTLLVFRDLGRAALADIPEETGAPRALLSLQATPFRDQNQLIYWHTGAKRLLHVGLP